MKAAARRVLLGVVVLGALLAASAAPAAACEACYGAAANSPLVSAARTGVFLLLGVTMLVQGGFAAFFVYLRRRARRAHDEEIASEWADLQRSSTQP